MEGILIALISASAILIPGYLTYRVQMRSLKESLRKKSAKVRELNIKQKVVERILDLILISDLNNSVDEVFSETKADRFIIAIAMNGKLDFNTISVVYQQFQGQDEASAGYRVDAIRRYKNLKIDSHYHDLLKTTEREGVLEVDTVDMPEDSLLKVIYQTEGVRHVMFQHLLRKKMDRDNDLLVFATLATHEDRPFTMLEKLSFKTHYESTIIPVIEQIINFEEDDNPEKFSL